MDATIKLAGPVPYGNTMFELQATITCSNGEVRCKQWSTHTSMTDAEEYRDRFNSISH